MSENSPRKWLQFQTKVLVPIFFILAALAGFLFWLVNDHFVKELNTQAHQAVETANVAFAYYQEARTRDLQSRYAGLFTDTRLRQVLQRDDAKTLQFLLKELIDDFGADVAIFSSGKGRDVIGAQRENIFDLSELQKALSPSVNQAMQGDFNIATVSAVGKIWEIVSLPVSVSEHSGVLTFSHAMNESVISEIKKLTHSEIVFVEDAKIVSSTFPSAVETGKLLPKFEKMLVQPGKQIEAVELGGGHFVALAGSLAALNKEGRLGYVLLYSSEKAWNDLHENQRRLALACAVGILLSCTLVWILVRHVTKPLHALRVGAESVGQGDFSQRVPISSRDEFGQLAVAFNQMTENLKTSRAQLEQTVERLKTTQNQLVQTEKLASVGEFVAGVTHELNNPLTAVIGFAELLKSSGISEEDREYAQRIVDGSQRCHNIVRSLLSFARKHKPERKMSNINELVENTLNFVSYEFRTSNIKIVRRLTPDIPCISVDPNQLQQVFLNIVTNARQAMEGRDGSKLETSTERVGNQLRVVFSDNGPGINPENVSRIFDPFFTTKEVGKGTGLGLSLSYGLIQEHGGTIRVESTIGEGARFIIELPITAENVNATSSSVADDSFAGLSRDGIGKKVLIIDDEEAVLKLVSSALLRWGFMVETVSDGEAGLRAVEQTDFDVIVCDWKMPGLNGQQVFETLRINHPEMAKRFLFMTGDIINERTQQFLRETGSVCISKPFSLAEFGTALKKIMQPDEK